MGAAPMVEDAFDFNPAVCWVVEQVPQRQIQPFRIGLADQSAVEGLNPYSLTSGGNSSGPRRQLRRAPAVMLCPVPERAGCDLVTA